MFLQDVEFSKAKKISKINKFLKESYGVTLDVDTDICDLVSVRDELTATLHECKVVKGLTPKDPEYCRYLLILEGIELFLGAAKTQLNEFAAPASYDETVTQEYQDYIRDSVLDELVNIAVCDITAGKPIEQSIIDAYNEYRSSPHIFDDASIEIELRDRVHNSVADIYRALRQSHEDVLLDPHSKLNEFEELTEIGLPFYKKRDAKVQPGIAKGYKPQLGGRTSIVHDTRTDAEMERDLADKKRHQELAKRTSHLSVDKTKATIPTVSPNLAAKKGKSASVVDNRTDAEMERDLADKKRHQELAKRTSHLSIEPLADSYEPEEDDIINFDEPEELEYYNRKADEYADAMASPWDYMLDDGFEEMHEENEGLSDDELDTWLNK